MGHEKLPVSEAVAAELEKMGRQVAEAIARGEFQQARELTEEAILFRASEAPLPDEDALAPGRWPSEK